MRFDDQGVSGETITNKSSTSPMSSAASVWQVRWMLCLMYGVSQEAQKKLADSEWPSEAAAREQADEIQSHNGDSETSVATDNIIHNIQCIACNIENARCNAHNATRNIQHGRHESRTTVIPLLHTLSFSFALVLSYYGVL